MGAPWQRTTGHGSDQHKDDWAGDVDIAEFAPRSVKSDGDFEDILAEDNPAIWHTNRPAKGGDTGAMFTEIIERAAKLKAARGSNTKDTKDAKGHQDTDRAEDAGVKEENANVG